MSFDKLQDKKQNIKLQEQAKKNKDDLLFAGTKIEKAVLEAAHRIIEHAQSRGATVSVTNLPKGLATSADIKALQSVLEQKDTNVQVTTKNNTDELKTSILQLLEVMQSIDKKDDSDVLLALESIEEELKSSEPVEVSNLDDLGNFFFSLEKAIEKIKLEVDLSPINKLGEAVSQIRFDMPADLMQESEKQLRKVNKNLEYLINKPTVVSSGGGGGSNGLQPSVDYDYLDVQQTSAAVETYVYKSGGSSGATVQTITMTYVDATKAELDNVEYT